MNECDAKSVGSLKKILQSTTCDAKTNNFFLLSVLGDSSGFSQVDFQQQQQEKINNQKKKSSTSSTSSIRFYPIHWRLTY
ncbi:hypothetical protein DERP_003879 [Dermatophagoides pteronyssinus]|uniref:Uncharacterized protein n=1 Tax=Dermatophagoides pteronyssinus TaxID=6956 RepID=A0ABQ8J7M1_DERPT|nr:hypothetical protein DERP_003879 [Dermatophagoides pteronyssinus]